MLADLLEIDGPSALPSPHQIQGGVDRRAMQIAPGAVRQVRLLFPAQQPGEHGLEHVFRVGRVACNPVRGAVDGAVMLPEDHLQGLERSRGAQRLFFIGCGLHASCPPFSFTHGTLLLTVYYRP
jgi:hypothetical protein